MAFEIVAAKKSNLPDEAKIRQALASSRPGALIEAIEDKGDSWLIRLKTAEGPPPFLKKEDDGPDTSSDSGDALSDSADDDSGDDLDSDDDSDSDGKGDSKGKGKGDPVKEVEGIISDLQKLLGDLGGKTKELQDAHQEKADKLDEIADTVGPGGLGDKPPLPADVGPTPGPKPPGGPPMAPGGIAGGGGPVPRRPGVPTGRGPRPGVPTAFSKRHTEVVNHPGVDEKGQKITLVAAAHELESNPDWKEYEVVGMTVNTDGSFAAKLKLR